MSVHTAPGGGAELVAEYEDFILVVEVTMTQGPRQEAWEGASVRRHVSKVIDDATPKNKSVLGLFVAPSIDVNTAEAFRHGIWYYDATHWRRTKIVPLTIRQFGELLQEAANARRLHPSIIRNALESVLPYRDSSGGAPQWLDRISDGISGTSFVVDDLDNKSDEIEEVRP